MHNMQKHTKYATYAKTYKHLQYMQKHTTYATYAKTSNICNICNICKISNKNTKYAMNIPICENIPCKDYYIYMHYKALYVVGPPRPAKTHTGSVHILHVFMSIYGICRNHRGCAYIYVYRVCPYFAFFCIFWRATREVSRAVTASEWHNVSNRRKISFLAIVIQCLSLFSSDF